MPHRFNLGSHASRHVDGMGTGRLTQNLLDIRLVDHWDTFGARIAARICRKDRSLADQHDAPGVEERSEVGKDRLGRDDRGALLPIYGNISIDYRDNAGVEQRRQGLDRQTIEPTVSRQRRCRGLHRYGRNSGGDEPAHNLTVEPAHRVGNLDHAFPAAIIANAAMSLVEIGPMVTERTAAMPDQHAERRVGMERRGDDLSKLPEDSLVEHFGPGFVGNSRAAELQEYELMHVVFTFQKRRLAENTWCVKQRER